MRGLEHFAGQDWGAVYEAWAADVKESASDAYGYPVLSRSTNVLSNLIEDVNKSVTVAVANATSYGHFSVRVSL